MTSKPASRRARATTLAPRSWPSSPGFATKTRMGRSVMEGVQKMHLHKMRGRRSRDHQGIFCGGETVCVRNVRLLRTHGLHDGVSPRRALVVEGGGMKAA